MNRKDVERQVQFHLTEALRLAVELARPQLVQVAERTGLVDRLENAVTKHEVVAMENEEIAALEEDAEEKTKYMNNAAKYYALATRLRERAAEARAREEAGR